MLTHIFVIQPFIQLVIRVWQLSCPQHSVFLRSVCANSAKCCVYVDEFNHVSQFLLVPHIVVPLKFPTALQPDPQCWVERSTLVILSDWPVLRFQYLGMHAP